MILMGCQCNYKSNIRTDCIHYHCEHDMGASIDCCTLKEGLGNCPCTKDCPDYADKEEVYRLGLEALKHSKNSFMNGGKMAQYHVGCGIAGIYAGTLKKNGEEWLNKSDVTNEAINAVVQHMYYQIPKNENRFALGFRMLDGKYVRLMVESADKCPEWAKDVLEKDDDGCGNDS